MSQRASSRITLRLVVRAAISVSLACSSSAQSLPGSKGPRVENVAAAPNGIKLLCVAVVEDLSAAGVSDAPRPADREKTLSQSFPS